jgi:hypothetical protein
MSCRTFETQWVVQVKRHTSTSKWLYRDTSSGFGVLHNISDVFSAEVFRMSQALPPDFSSLGMDPTALYYTGIHGNNGLPGGFAASQV